MDAHPQKLIEVALPLRVMIKRLLNELKREGKIVLESKKR